MESNVSNDIDTVARLAYFAGFFDGEGHVRIRAKASLSVIILNTYKPILEELQRCYGGCISNTANARNGWKPAWGWYVSSVQARQFLLDILPYLREKREKVETCLGQAKYRTA